MKKRIKIQGLLILASIVALVFFWRHLVAQERNLWLDISGAIIILLGYFLRISARGTKSELNPDGKTLVVSGPYVLTRNPMYLGTFLIGLGIILEILQWWVGIIFLFIYLLIYVPQINLEEQTLRGRFQEAFMKYCSTTPKFFPSPRTLFFTSPAGYLRFNPGWLKKESASLVLTFVFVLGIKLIINFTR